MSILVNQTYEEQCLIEFRGLFENARLPEIVQVMQNYVKEQGAKCIKNPITTIHGMDSTSGIAKYDMEIYIPIDKAIKSNESFVYKPFIKIVNALKIVHTGDIRNLQKTCDILNQFILDNNLKPITSGYNVTVNDNEVDVFVGINPNIL